MPAGTPNILAVCDAVAQLIEGVWSPTAPDAVTREYIPDIPLTDDVAEDERHTGRRVYVFPAGYEEPDFLSRAELAGKHAIAVLVVERYTGAGKPPKAWVDARVNWTGETIFRTLRDPDLSLLADMVGHDPETPASWDSVYDHAVLLNHKTYWSVVTVTFQEGVEL